MLAGNIFALPLAVLLTFSNESQPTFVSSSEEAAPRPPGALQPPGRWSTASWGPCGNPCGAGEERRQVACVLEDVTSTLIVAADGFCAPPKPTGVRQCYQYRSECANAWVAGDWGQCSAKCGGGQRSRVVECHAGRGGDAAGAPPTGSSATPPTPPTPLPEAQCVAQLRPPERRDCNLHPCPDGRRVWLRTSDGRRPRRIRLFSKFTLRCPFPVFYTPADDRSKRKYAWYKDGQRLPLHEDKYAQTDNKGELRVKGADEPDSGVYMCTSLTANPQGQTHNVTVRLQRVPGDPDPTPTTPDEDSPEGAASSEHEDADAGGVGGQALPPPPVTEPPRVPESTTAGAQEPPPSSTTPATSGPKDNVNQSTDGPESTEPPAPLPAPAAMGMGRPKRRSESVVDESSSPSGAIEVHLVAARYDAPPFTECSASCGSTGVRQRSVRCVNNETGAKLPLAACEDLGPPPPPQEACNRVDCPAAWQWPSWAGSTCSHPCGGGSKFRQARCSQTRADGAEVSLAAGGCAHLGPGEERRDCHRAPCRSRVHEGELVRLECRVPQAGWRRNNASLVVVDTDKYLADADTGTLYVFAATMSDAGRYECVERAEDGTVRPHLFDVVVLPSRPLPRRGQHDELFVRVGGCNGTAPAPAPPRNPDGGDGVSAPTATAATMATEDGGDVETTTDSSESAGVTEAPIPWHRLLTPAAPARGRILGVFS